jgi:hypothetical protein
MRFIVTAAAAALVLTRCGGGAAVDEIPADTLVFTDTVGVLLGDSSMMFGAVSRVIPVPEGFAVLDGVYCRLSFFGPDGGFLRSAGRAGAGPGEFSRPLTFCRLRDGGFLVYDLGAGSMMRLSPDLEFLGSCAMDRSYPMDMHTGTDSTVVMNLMALDLTDEGIMAGFRLQALNSATGEPVVTYMEHMAALGSSGLDLRPFWPIFCTDGEGEVYVSLLDGAEYRIDRYSPGGELEGSIVLPPEERPPFDSEAHSLIFLPITMPIQSNDGSCTLAVSAPETHPYVTGLSVDRDGNIWVRRMGLADSERWDVVSREGELLRRVVLLADTTGGDYPALHVSPDGMAATRQEYETERFYMVGPGEP